MNAHIISSALRRITAADEGIPREGVEVKFRYTGTNVLYVRARDPRAPSGLSITPGTEFYSWRRGGVDYIRQAKKTMAVLPHDMRKLAKQSLRIGDA